MFIYLLKLVSVVVLVLLQYSFFNYVFPLTIVPNVVATVVVVLVISDGFDMWPWVVFMGILADILSFSVIGKNVIILISAAYLINFISKRFLLDQHEKKASLIFLLLFAVTLFVNIFNIIWADSFSLMNLAYLKGSVWSVSKAMLIQALLSLMIFYVIHGLIEKVKRNVLFHNKPSF
ncbi:rod shape-determining protein MreD [Patescibacteria group bacterium]